MVRKYLTMQWDQRMSTAPVSTCISHLAFSISLLSLSRAHDLSLGRAIPLSLSPTLPFPSLFHTHLIDSLLIIIPFHREYSSKAGVDVTVYLDHHYYDETILSSVGAAASELLG